MVPAWEPLIPNHCGSSQPWAEEMDFGVSPPSLLCWLRGTGGGGREHKAPVLPDTWARLRIPEPGTGAPRLQELRLPAQPAWGKGLVAVMRPSWWQGGCRLSPWHRGGLSPIPCRAGKGRRHRGQPLLSPRVPRGAIGSTKGAATIPTRALGSLWGDRMLLAPVYPHPSAAPSRWPALAAAPFVSL